jgi:hypothetical protein
VLGADECSRVGDAPADQASGSRLRHRPPLTLQSG